MFKFQVMWRALWKKMDLHIFSLHIYCVKHHQKLKYMSKKLCIRFDMWITVRIGDTHQILEFIWMLLVLPCCDSPEAKKMDVEQN